MIHCAFMQGVHGLWMPIKASFSSELESAKVQVREWCEQGQSFQSDAGRDALHLTWERLSRRFNFYYRRDPP